MGNVARTGNWALGQLQRQLNFLMNSCELYRQGHDDEAIRLATCVRVLCHQTGASTSLFTHLGIVEEIQMLDTAFRPDEYIRAVEPILRAQGIEGEIGCGPFHPGLAVHALGLDGRPGWFAPIDDCQHRRWQSFAIWWDGTAIDRLVGSPISRRFLVLKMANEDGGAHVSDEITDFYLDQLDNSHGYGVALGDHTETREDEIPWVAGDWNLAFATMRQIAYEVHASLIQHYNLGE